MDLLHLLLDDVVHGALPLQQRHPIKLGAHDEALEFDAAAAARAVAKCVARVRDRRRGQWRRRGNSLGELDVQRLKV